MLGEEVLCELNLFVQNINVD